MSYMVLCHIVLCSESSYHMDSPTGRKDLETLNSNSVDANVTPNTTETISVNRLTSAYPLRGIEMVHTHPIVFETSGVTEGSTFVFHLFLELIYLEE